MEWKYIKGTNNRYMISNTGVVKSLISNKNLKPNIKKKIQKEKMEVKNYVK